MTPLEIQEAWRRYKQQANADSRDRLIEHYAYLVKITSGRIISSLPAGLQRESLVSAGAVGLIKAVDQFDTTRQVKFETYAIALIRGAILDMLREDDWVPRSIRERVTMLERTYMTLEGQLGRAPTDDEAARALSLDPAEYSKLLMETGRTTVISLQDVLMGGDGGENLHVADVVQDDSAGPYLESEMRERRRLLGRAVDRVPERERLVIALYYYEGMTFKEIAHIMQISESRVYQLHTQAVIRLRGYLQLDNELFR